MRRVTPWFQVFGLRFRVVLFQPVTPYFKGVSSTPFSTPFWRDFASIVCVRSMRWSHDVEGDLHDAAVWSDIVCSPCTRHHHPGLVSEAHVGEARSRLVNEDQTCTRNSDKEDDEPELPEHEALCTRRCPSLLDCFSALRIVCGDGLRRTPNVRQEKRSANTRCLARTGLEVRLLREPSPTTALVLSCRISRVPAVSVLMNCA